MKVHRAETCLNRHVVQGSTASAASCWIEVDHVHYLSCVIVVDACHVRQRPDIGLRELFIFHVSVGCITECVIRVKVYHEHMHLTANAGNVVTSRSSIEAIYEDYTTLLGAHLHVVNVGVIAVVSTPGIAILESPKFNFLT